VQSQLLQQASPQSHPSQQLSQQQSQVQSMQQSSPQSQQQLPHGPRRCRIDSSPEKAATAGSAQPSGAAAASA